MPIIHAEVALDRQHIVLVAGGDPHELAACAKRLELLTPLFSTSTPPGALTTPLTWPAVVQLRATFGDTLVVLPHLQAWIDDQVRRRTQPTDAPLSFPIPEGLTPYTWQVAGAHMIAAANGALITDEPGTGKTITAILGLLEHATNLQHCDCAPPYADCMHPPEEFTGPALIVCPASVVDPWVEAWRTWAPHVSVTAWRGPKRRELAGGYEVYVMSYETARDDTPVLAKPSPLLKLEPAALVIDECHMIKNPTAKRTEAVHRLANRVTKNGGPVVALSGTPITHHPGDLWSSLYAITPGAWPARGRWTKRYCLVLDEDYGEEVLGLHPATEPEFRVTMLGQHRRIAKADVLTQLPPKVYSVRYVDLPEKWRKVYDDFEKTMLAELPDGEELAVFDALSVLSHLRALSAAAADVEVTYGPDVHEDGPKKGEPKRHVHLDLKAPSWKVDELLALLEERPGEPVVAFAESKQLMLLAAAAAAKKGRKVGTIVGGQTQAVRTETVRAFQAGELDLVCVTTAAGGVGITLTAARTVVFLQRPWSLVNSIQAEDRCHRIGAEKHESIEVIDIVARNTLDSRVRAALRDRAEQLADLVGDPRIVTELLGGTKTDNKPEEAA